MNSDLKIIKNKYGEQMMHLCRTLFPSLLETKGLLSSLILEHFAPSKILYDDIITHQKEEEFKNYIYSLIDVEKKEEIKIPKTPQELLDIAGYNLYECKTEEDIQVFKKYYKTGEELCTFKGGRLDRCYVFFAVKKNVYDIKREKFKKPQREDEYGTSVISIQFAKGDANTLSIKNRYNHAVINPDATFSNNLDNIIPGLTESFERKYNLNLIHEKNQLYIPGYVQANNGIYYKYNYEINNVYYCPNNIIIDNFELIDKYSAQEKYIVADYFIIDLVNKTINLYNDSLKDSFVDELKNITKINISKSKNTGNKTLELIINNKTPIIIELDKTNKIIRYRNENIVDLNNNFMYKNTSLISLELPNLMIAWTNFLSCNTELISLETPKLNLAGSNFLKENKKINKVTLPNLQQVGDNFLHSNTEITSLSLPNLTNAGSRFLCLNIKLNHIELPKLRIAINRFLFCNNALTSINLPNLEDIGDDFLVNNQVLEKLYLPKLKGLASNFLYSNTELTNLSLPNVTTIGGHFLYHNNKLITLDLPKLKNAGIYFMYKNTKLFNLNLPNLTETGIYFLHNHEQLKNFNLQNFRNKSYESNIKKIEKLNTSLATVLINRIKELKYKIKKYKEIVLDTFRSRI